MREFHYGSKKIFYHLEFSKRKTLGITVTPDMEVFIKAPEGTPIDRIEEKIEKRARWILKQQSYFLRFYPKMPEQQYRSGESHLYLGRHYRLKTTIAKRNEVHFSRGEVRVYHTTKSSTKSVLLSWYRTRAKEKFAEIAEPWITHFERYGVKPEGLFIQEMPTRWGSCTAKGKIILNPQLIKAPKPCIEYVIIHELCHLIHKHHTPHFFQLQAALMPDWEKMKNKLEELMV